MDVICHLVELNANADFELVKNFQFLLRLPIVVNVSHLLAFTFYSVEEACYLYYFCVTLYIKISMGRSALSLVF